MNKLGAVVLLRIDDTGDGDDASSSFPVSDDVAAGAAFLFSFSVLLFGLFPLLPRCNLPPAPPSNDKGFIDAVASVIFFVPLFLFVFILLQLLLLLLLAPFSLAFSSNERRKQ